VTLSGPYKNAKKHACRKPENRETKKSEIDKQKQKFENGKI
jgi:hypothetical protein